MFRPRGTAEWEKPARFAARSIGNTLSTGRTVLPWSSPTPETRINELGNSAVISLPAPPTPDCNSDVLLPEELVARGGGEQAFTTELTIVWIICRDFQWGSVLAAWCQWRGYRVASRSSQSFNRNPPADEVRMNRPEYTAGRCGRISSI